MCNSALILRLRSTKLAQAPLTPSVGFVCTVTSAHASTRKVAAAPGVSCLLPAVPTCTAATASHPGCEKSIAQQPALFHTCLTLHTVFAGLQAEHMTFWARAQPRDQPCIMLQRGADIPAKPPRSHHHARRPDTAQGFIPLALTCSAACLQLLITPARLFRSTATWTAAASACASAASCASSSTAQQTVTCQSSLGVQGNHSGISTQLLRSRAINRRSRAINRVPHLGAHGDRRLNSSALLAGGGCVGPYALARVLHSTTLKGPIVLQAACSCVLGSTCRCSLPCSMADRGGEASTSSWQMFQQRALHAASQECGASAPGRRYTVVLESLALTTQQCGHIGFAAVRR